MKYTINKETVQCLECGNVIAYGRTDKKFCDTTCRNRWHNKNAHDVRVIHARINGHIARNYKILDNLLKAGVSSASFADLAVSGFHVGYFTSVVIGRGCKEYMCYELCYKLDENGVCDIHRASRRGGCPPSSGGACP